MHVAIGVCVCVCVCVFVCACVVCTRISGVERAGLGAVRADGQRKQGTAQDASICDNNRGLSL